MGLKITAAGLDVPVEIKPEDLDPLLKPLDTTIESLKESLDGSFLSQKTISNLVDKLATDVPESDAPETGIKRCSTVPCTILFTTSPQRTMRKRPPTVCRM